jgi:rubrerythrin
MFTFLMEEEEKHREAIAAQIARMAEGKHPKRIRGPADRKAIRKFRSPLFTEDFVAKGRNVEGEAAALSIGMTLEKRAIEQFGVLRRKVKGDASAERLFDELIAWEKEHLDILARQYGQLREMYWEEARFWPF